MDLTLQKKSKHCYGVEKNKKHSLRKFIPGKQIHFLNFAFIIITKK